MSSQGGDWIPPKPTSAEVTGVILAGGRARRLGGIDKGLLPVAGKPLIAWVIEGLVPQVGGLLISANRNLDTYGGFGYPVISDTLDGFQGPLSGILSAMGAAPTPWILTVPCDGPCLPPDLVPRLIRALAEAQATLAVASDGVCIQPVFGLLPVSLVGDLREYLALGKREVGRWLGRHRLAVADFHDHPDAFANLNTPGEQARLEEMLAR